MRNAVIIDEADNVVVAIYPLDAGADVEYVTRTGEVFGLSTNEPIPLFHKIARVDIPEGSAVTKYGEYIGIATENIAAGDHVHVHNCVSTDAMKETEDENDD